MGTRQKQYIVTPRNPFGCFQAVTVFWLRRSVVCRMYYDSKDAFSPNFHSYISKTRLKKQDFDYLEAISKVIVALIKFH